jgi:hypothetical protein
VSEAWVVRASKQVENSLDSVGLGLVAIASKNLQIQPLCLLHLVEARQQQAVAERPYFGILKLYLLLEHRREAESGFKKVH